MSEYIVDFGNSMAMLSRIIESPSTELRGQIVRCRDCVYYDVTGEEHRLYSDKVYCEKLWKYVEPDGFCSWAERKEGGDD